MPPSFFNAPSLPLPPTFNSVHTRHAQVVIGLLAQFEKGQIILKVAEGTPLTLGREYREQPNQAPLCAQWQINHPDTFTQIIERGDIGFAESYIDGQWQTNDLTALVTMITLNRAVLKQAIYGSWWLLLWARLRHRLRRNTKRGASRNIMAHYDLGNDFYRLWLDESMTYSSALFNQSAEQSLSSAQRNKYQHIVDALGAQPGERVLEIGCGWGGFAELALSQGLAVTGLTISPAQLSFARARVPKADFRLQDYRDVQGQFDHIVSIEMFEAVGEKWWATYFSVLSRCLKPNGVAVVQTIVIDEALYPDYRRNTDFIQQYIFPGGMLASPSAFKKVAAGAGLSVSPIVSFGPDYARTLAQWRANFFAAWEAIAALGFDERFRRLWHFYLSYCEAGFLAGNINVVQFRITHATSHS